MGKGNGNCVLTLYVGNIIQIGDIEIKINEYTKNQVRLAINAPRDLIITRKVSGRNGQHEQLHPKGTDSNRIPKDEESR